MIKEYHKSLISFQKEIPDSDSISSSQNNSLPVLIENTRYTQEKFASLCAYANSIVKDVEDREKSDRIHRKYPRLLSDVKSYDQHGLCRLDSDLQTTFYEASSNNLSKRRLVFLFDKVIVVVNARSRLPKVIRRIYLDDYRIEDNATDGQMVNPEINRSDSVFTFFVQEWPHKFHMVPKTKVETLGNGPADPRHKRITFAASTIEVKRNWVAAIKDKQSRLTPKAIESDQDNKWDFVLKTFGRDGKLPEFCDVSNTVLPGLYLQGIHVTKKIRKDFTMTKTYKINCDQVGQFLMISDEESKNQKSNQMEAISHLLPAKTSPTNRSCSKPSFNPPTHFGNSSSMHQSSKPGSIKSSFIKSRTNLSSSSSFATRDQSPSSGFSSDSNNKPEDYKIPYKVRLDDFDWYVPTCDRGSVARCLPRDSRLKNGAFVVRSSSRSSYALSVVYNPDSNVSVDLSNPTHFKHITISEIKRNQSSNGESEIEFYINTIEDEDGKFSNILDLIEYYKVNQLSKHFSDLNTCLVDVFEETESIRNTAGTIPSSRNPSVRNQSSRESIHRSTGSARNRPERSDSRTFRSGSQSVHVNNLLEPISSDPVWSNQTMFDVTVIPRSGEGSYTVLGYCSGEYEWNAQDTNQFNVNQGDLFCIVGTAMQGWLQ